MDRSSVAASVRDATSRSRWIVHLALMATFVAATVSAVFLSRRYAGHSGTTDHAIFGLSVLAAILVHLVQRRRTVRRLLAQLVGKGTSSERRTRLAVSDTLLWLLTLNAMVSGVADYVVGHTILLPFSVPTPLQKWHATSVVILLVYVIVHVVRRRRRLRTSHIR